MKRNRNEDFLSETRKAMLVLPILRFLFLFSWKYNSQNFGIVDGEGGRMAEFWLITNGRK